LCAGNLYAVTFAGNVVEAAERRPSPTEQAVATHAPREVKEHGRRRGGVVVESEHRD
jgi:hypothetical protein